MARQNLAIRRTATGTEILPATDDAEAIDLLRRLLLSTRVKTLMAYKRGMCRACDYPHPRERCRHECVCHEVIRYLKSRGIEIES